jgi:hypothetical protein
VNIEVAPPNTQCVEAHEDEIWKCLMSPYLLPHIHVPLFFIQSQYDAWVIPNILGLGCVVEGSLELCTQDELQFIEQHHKEVYSNIYDGIRMHESWGGWAPSCINHW